VRVLAFIALVSFVGTVKAAHDHRERLAHRSCVRRPYVVRVSVGRPVVAYAHRSGWPRVLVVGGDRVRGDLTTYDHGWQARRVREKSEGLCSKQRFRPVS
jgi:hypothetical protein